MTDWDIDQLNLFKKVVSYISIGILIFGITGNILCAKVLHRVQKTVKGVRLLKYLAVVDVLVLVLYILPRALRVLMAEWLSTVTVNIIYRCTAFLLHPIQTTILMLEVYMTVIISVQRCLAIAMPFKFKRWMRESVMNKALASVLAFTVLFNIYFWIYYRPVFYWNNYVNMTLITSADGLGQGFAVDYALHITSVILLNGLPMVLMVLSNIILIISRQRMTRFGRRDRSGAHRLTVLVLAVTFLSIAIHCVSIVFIALENVVQRIYSAYIVQLLICINSSTNFIFYCCFGREFRRTLAAMIKCRISTRQPHQADRLASTTLRMMDIGSNIQSDSVSNL